MRVEWTESALDRLADLYVAADVDEQHDIEAIVETINSCLADNPWQLGESRPGNRRIWFVPPLFVVFRVIDTDDCVLVSHVARSSRR
jgi:hypothetical protein